MALNCTTPLRSVAPCSAWLVSASCMTHGPGNGDRTCGECRRINTCRARLSKCEPHVFEQVNEPSMTSTTPVLRHPCLRSSGSTAATRSCMAGRRSSTEADNFLSANPYNSTSSATTRCTLHANRRPRPNKEDPRPKPLQGHQGA